MVSPKNLNTKINAPFIMQAHHALENFLWKTCLNLYLKWAMTFRSPHPFFLSFFVFWIFFFFGRKKKKWPSFISTHQNPLLVPLQSLSWMFTLSPHEGLGPSFKSLIHFLSFILKWALPLVQVWSIGSKRFPLLILIGLLVSWAYPCL